MSKSSAPTTVLLLAFLVFHFITPTLAKHGSCGCSKHGHEMGISCDCPGCLAQRAGRPCCSSQDKGASDEGKAAPVLKPLRCTCGAQDEIASPMGNLPFIPHSGPSCGGITPIGPVETAVMLLCMEDVSLPLDRPG